jgi:hypothetical protein
VFNCTAQNVATIPGTSNSLSEQLDFLCFQAFKVFQFARAFSAAQADSMHRIVENNVALLRGDDAMDGITGIIVRERWNRALGHFSVVRFLQGDDFSLACETDVCMPMQSTHTHTQSVCVCALQSV